MRYLVTTTLLALAWASTTHAQEAADPLEYEKIIHIEGADAGELYARARIWFVEVFNDSESVLELEDADAHILMGKGAFQHSSCNFVGIGPECAVGKIRFTIRVDTKDGRARATLSQLTHETPACPDNDYGLITDAPSPGKCVPTCTWPKARQNCWEELKAAIPPKVEELHASLKSRISQPSTDDC